MSDKPQYIVIIRDRSSTGLTTEYELVNAEQLPICATYHDIYPTTGRLTDKEKKALGVGTESVSHPTRNFK
jgi:hypothetical protein